MDNNKAGPVKRRLMSIRVGDRTLDAHKRYVTYYECGKWNTYSLWRHKHDVGEVYYLLDLEEQQQDSIRKARHKTKLAWIYYGKLLLGNKDVVRMITNMIDIPPFDQEKPPLLEQKTRGRETVIILIIVLLVSLLLCLFSPFL